MGIEALLIGGATALSVFGKLQEGKAAEEAATFNAGILRQRAQSERDSANAEAADFERRQGAALAGARAARAGTGVTFEGSPLLVDTATVREIVLGAERMRHGGEKRGRILETEADLAEMTGDQARKAGYIGAGRSLLTGGLSYAQSSAPVPSYSPSHYDPRRAGSLY